MVKLALVGWRRVPLQVLAASSQLLNAPPVGAAVNQFVTVNVYVIDETPPAFGVAVIVTAPAGLPLNLTTPAVLTVTAVWLELQL